MDYYSKQLIDLLKDDEHKEYRKKLYSKLNADINEIFVYYLVPLSNLIQIVNDGGIECRNNSGGNFEDLSGQNVQSIRSKIDINFNGYIKKNIHQCINFFLNPTNYTFIAFQRKALFNSFKQNTPLDKPVCILEISLGKILNDSNIKWSVSKKNLASDSFASFVLEGYKKYEWEKIFSNVSSNKEYNKFQSAEFIVFKGNNSNSEKISDSFINRIIIHENDKNDFENNLPQHKEKIHTNSILFLNYGYLLFPGKKLLEQIINIDKNEIIPIKKLINILSEFKNICNHLDFFLTSDKFSSESMVYSQHGISHITRVLFWVNILNYLNNNLNNEISNITNYAALIHDLGKENNKENEKHGNNSAKMHSDCLTKKIVNKEYLERCINAIKYHSIDDSECPPEIQNDIIWKTLKDADALDRGRFGKPNTKDGCKEKYFRLDILKNNTVLSNKLVWSAYGLARITQYTFWNKDTCVDLINEIADWILTYANYCETTSIEKEFIKKIKEL